MAKCGFPRDYLSYKRYIERWLDSSRSDVAAFIREEVAVTWNGDVAMAVADALEHQERFPDRDTEELDRVQDLYESWCEWLDDWEPKGWQIDVSGSNVTLTAPNGSEWKGLWRRGSHPSDDVIAAAAGVLSVKFKGAESGFDPPEVTYVVNWK